LAYSSTFPPGHNTQLDDNSPYFDFGIRSITQNGIYHFLNTRNNDFSNRNQVGKIVVGVSAAAMDLVGWNGGVVKTASQWVSAQQGAFSALSPLGIESVPASGTNTTFSGNAGSDFINLVFDPTALATPQSSVQVSISYSATPLMTPSVKSASSVTGSSWTPVSSSFSAGNAQFSTNQPGTYVVDNQLNGGAIAGIVIGCVVAVALIIGGIVWYRKKKAGITGSSGALAMTASRA